MKALLYFPPAPRNAVEKPSSLSLDLLVCILFTPLWKRLESLFFKFMMKCQTKGHFSSCTEYLVGPFYLEQWWQQWPSSCFIGQIWPATVFIKFYWHIHSFTYSLWHYITMYNNLTETVCGLQCLKYLWPFIENICWSLI